MHQNSLPPHELEEFAAWLDGQDRLENTASEWQREYYYVVEEGQKKLLLVAGSFYL